MVQDYRKRQDPRVKGKVVAKLGLLTYRVQVKEFIWKRHIDQLKDLSGTKIQPHWQEQLEDCEVNVPQSFAAYLPTKTPVTTVGHFPLHSEPGPNQSQPRVTQAKPVPEQQRDLANQEAFQFRARSLIDVTSVFVQRDATHYVTEDRLSALSNKFLCELWAV